MNDANCTGEPNVEITYQNGPLENVELGSLDSAIKGIDLRCTNNGNHQFEKITRALQDHVSKASSILAETNVQIQKEVDEFQKYCQTIDENVICKENWFFV